MIEWKSWAGLGIAVLIAIVLALVVVVLTALITRGAGRRREWPHLLASKARHPYRLLVLVVGVWIAVALTLPDKQWRDDVNHAFLIVTIALATWLIGALLGYGLGLAVTRYRTDVPDNRAARRAQTQILIVRRLLVVIVIGVGLASVLLTFPGVRVLGASVLASAGVLSIVAGLAAQSSLANVFAGVQLAFSDAIRVDDVVVVDAEWGRIEEITLTYVVVHVWDDRRLVVPSTYFTSNPFENWTRSSSQLLGEIDFDLDWQVNTAGMREQLGVILAATPIWDGRTSVLQVTDAVGGYVHVRILVSAVDSPTLFDLRCHVREAMVDWVQQQSRTTMPRTRVQLTEDDAKARPRRVLPKKTETGLFTGTPKAKRRAQEFTSPIQVVHGRQKPDPAASDTAKD